MYVFSDVDTLDIQNPKTDNDITVLNDCNRSFSDNYSDSIMMLCSSENSSDNYQIILDDKVNVNSDGFGMNGVWVPEMLPDDKDTFIVKPKKENGTIHCDMVLDNHYIFVKCDSAQSAVFENKGKVSVNGNNGNYQLTLVFDDGYGELPWGAVDVYGFNATNQSSLEMADVGMIFKSDNMDYIEVRADNGDRNNIVATKFSTKEKAVQIKAVNDTTLGIYVDADKDGVYEKLIADSIGTDYGYYDDSPVKAPDNPMNNRSADTDSKTGDSKLPVFIATILAAISGITAVILLKTKRRKNKQ